MAEVGFVACDEIAGAGRERGHQDGPIFFYEINVGRKYREAIVRSLFHLQAEKLKPVQGITG